MTDQFHMIERGENGHPHVCYCLDPSEVTIIRDPQAGDAVIGYVWEPVGEVPQPIRTFPKGVSSEALERFIAEYEAARSHPLFVSLSPIRTHPWANPRLIEKQPDPGRLSRRLRRWFGRSQ